MSVDVTPGSDRVDKRKHLQGRVRLNNTLRQGKPGDGGAIRIMIASVGQLLGWEDTVNQRPLTAAARCLSETGRLLAIDKDDFIKHMSKDDETWLMFGDISRERDAITKGVLRGERRARSQCTVPAEVLAT